MLTRHAIILAAGLGSRLDPREGHKLLAVLGGRPLLDYHLEAFDGLGVSCVSIVTGHEAQALEAALAEHPVPEGLELRVARNEDFQKGNGLSVLAGVDGPWREPGVGAAGLPCDALPCWLTMSDHIFQPSLIEALASWRPAPATEGMLAVDRKIDQIFDVPDATKLRLDEGGKLEAIGKEIGDFDLVDVGLFWCGAGFVEALRQALTARGDCSTSDAVRALFGRGAFELWDVGQAQWQDVDTPGAREHAEGLLRGW